MRGVVGSLALAKTCACGHLRHSLLRAQSGMPFAKFEYDRSMTHDFGLTVDLLDAQNF